ncbi:hypothetical protein [Agrilutibacter solisilvae]|uniref:DUF4402 domain-containing protein n=1 Tax=Agrilutibacter solisilvae TaxID=2763317 RepID=A0A974XXW8_9GAMM|nr:hypothetical protein [Lysobacter solisilvae]QSX77807.1 hypothetical protein I8J32_013900 [Lysobacter solisilvae]
MRKFMSLLLGILLPSGVVEAAELPIGPMMFKLGESRATVLAEAQTRFALVPVGGNPDMIFLSSGEPPNAKIVGGIAFKDGRLSWVQRNWGNFTGSTAAIDVAKAVQSALSSAASASGSRATITTEEKQVPGTDFRSTYFQFPGHKVSITVADSNDTSYGQQVTVDESISL